ncbi:MAG: rRNA pseudouridine synthase [Clostridia bacterium]|nr:rRNA pseudouridine synthase [Clostridia bacterium]
MRIDKYIGNSTHYSRKELKVFFKKGLVRLNGEVVTDIGKHINEETDEVSLSGEVIKYSKFTYLMLNKPAGYISATFDKKFPVVTDLVPEEFSHLQLFPVGRLDLDTVGLLVLTNDGDLAHRLLIPKSHVPKTYFVKSEKPLTEDGIKVFEAGVDLGDFTTIPAKVEKLSENETHLTIFEGKYHQVKRMYEAIDNKVIYLKRVKMGELELDETIEEGKMRPLTDEEIKKLMNNE